jgi:hypothetical protein
MQARCTRSTGHSLLASISLLVASSLGLPAAAAQISLSPVSVIGGSGSFGGSLVMTTPWNVGGGNVFDSQGPGPKFESPQTTGGAWHGNDGDLNEFIVIDLGGSYDLTAFDIFNSHNGTWNDRWVNTFSITGANAVAAPGSCETGAGTCGLDLFGATTLIVSGTLLFDADPINAQSYLVSPTQAFRYLRFNGHSGSAIGTGINELHIHGTVPEPGGLLLLGSTIVAFALMRRRVR